MLHSSRRHTRQRIAKMVWFAFKTMMIALLTDGNLFCICYSRHHHHHHHLFSAQRTIKQFALDQLFAIIMSMIEFTLSVYTKNRIHISSDHILCGVFSSTEGCYFVASAMIHLGMKRVFLHNLSSTPRIIKLKIVQMSDTMKRRFQRLLDGFVNLFTDSRRPETLYMFVGLHIIFWWPQWQVPKTTCTHLANFVNCYVWICWQRVWQK